MLDEFHGFVIPETTPKALVDDYLEPYTKAYTKLKTCSYTATQDATEINDILYWLNKIGNYDWMPSAILFMSQHSNESKYVLWFVEKLERLASYLQVTARDVNHRMSRYKHIIAELKENPNSSIDNPIKNIELTEWEKEEFFKTLNGDIYNMPSARRNYIIQRLDSFVSDGGAIYNSSVFTIEHVLPQNPSLDSEWLKLWPEDETRAKWLNKVANLVPLTRQRNSAAQNYDFDTKKEKYFTTRSGTSSYQLTTQVLSVAKWTPEVVENRQKYILEVFATKWDLRAKEGVKENEIYLVSGRGGSAFGYPQENDKFIVLSGSKISDDTTKGFHAGYAELRDKLINSDVIKNGRFVGNYTFESPSAAAAVILGRSANGRREWTLLDGRSLGKQI